MESCSLNFYPQAGRSSAHLEKQSNRGHKTYPALSIKVLSSAGLAEITRPYLEQVSVNHIE